MKKAIIARADKVLREGKKTDFSEKFTETEAVNEFKKQLDIATKKLNELIQGSNADEKKINKHREIITNLNQSIKRLGK